MLLKENTGQAPREVGQERWGSMSPGSCHSRPQWVEGSALDFSFFLVLGDLLLSVPNTHLCGVRTYTQKF